MKKIPPLRQVEVVVDGLLYRVVPVGNLGPRYTVYQVADNGSYRKVKETYVWQRVVAEAIALVNRKQRKAEAINALGSSPDVGSDSSMGSRSSSNSVIIL